MKTMIVEITYQSWLMGTPAKRMLSKRVGSNPTVIETTPQKLGITFYYLLIKLSSFMILKSIFDSS
jgi:hypothetical protein